MFSYVDGTTAGRTGGRKRRKSRSQSQSKAPKHDMPLEERLKEVLASTSASAGDGYLPSDSPSTVKAEELVVTLIKGLHALDKKLIEQVVDTTNLEIVKSTVRRLPVQSLLPLLRELTNRIRVKSDVRPYVRWLHIVLSTHLAYLASVPEIVDELCSQHEILESRINLLDKVLRLQGRLGLILDQFSDKALPQNRLELSNKAAKAVFIEESEPEEELDLSPQDEQTNVKYDWKDIEWSDEDDEPTPAQNEDIDIDENEDEDDRDFEEGDQTNNAKQKHIRQNGIVNGGGEYSDEEDGDGDGEEDEENDDSEDDGSEQDQEFSSNRLKKKRKFQANEDIDEMVEFS